MWVSLCVSLHNIEGSKLRNSQDAANIIDHNLSIFVSLKQEKLASFLVIVSIYGSDRHFLFNAHVV
jgi:hypothetical protein